jgi:hypothetical protein
MFLIEFFGSIWQLVSKTQVSFISVVFQVAEGAEHNRAVMLFVDVLIIALPTECDANYVGLRGDSECAKAILCDYLLTYSMDQSLRS